MQRFGGQLWFARVDQITRGANAMLTELAGAARVVCIMSVACVGGLGVSACSTVPIQSTAAATAIKARALLTTFNVSGRIAARDVGEIKRGFSGGFSWNHTQTDDVVELLTPLGQIAARLTMTASGTTIELANGQRVTTGEPEAYVARVLGLRLPIRALPYWMQGAPVPGSAIRVEADSVGRLGLLWQDGWQIRYGDYASASFEANPTQIDLTQGDIEARILIDEWKGP